MMEPAQANPLRRRRRWLIVTFVLVLVSGVAWWEWPRGDARFVGKWAHVEYEREGPLFYLHLSSNGMGTWRGTTGERSLPFAWRVEGDRFIWGSKRYLDRPWIQSMVDYCGYSIIREKSYRIMEIEQDRIRVEGWVELKLRRIPE